MHNVGRVDVLQPSQQLIQKEFVVLFSEMLIAFDDRSEISVYQLRNDIDILKLLPRLGQHDTLNAHNILMFQQSS